MASYIREVCQQLGMTYKPPSLPVDLRYNPQQASSGEVSVKEDDTFDADAHMQDFRAIQHKHNIRLG